ncbi:actin monomer binding protein-like protein [Hortaea werneckii]|nr:actin monomer binding protein-like protein [Hortaea werneckii]KAI6856872.1 actin monomer binding protein-like protein [Hortaea werneckii]KAI7345489.1 actin monomer binding protein-like protein [Hortaea werneckii]KAI7607964.1 actin monomer binding protein-like protein [Hortaea werneckii]KAI7684290.1 actin monomer binding protein-like protein [Hortaea werneckii]
MQSGISATKELQDAFNALVSSTDQRAVLASIDNEQLVPTTTLAASSASFSDDLHKLQDHLSQDRAAYVLVKTQDAPDGYVAVTFVPNAAPVRQKMLFASTRLTLVRELGLERFRQQIFCTEKEELTPEGWAKHDAHVSLEAPLTEEESGLKGVKDAEAAESMGTSGRRGHVSSRVDIKTGDGVLEALRSLKEEGFKGTLVQLKYQLPDEILMLDSSNDGVQPDAVGKTINSAEPRYSFYSVPSTSGSEPEIAFIYTCPSGSKIKERMVYSTGKSWTRIVAERDAGIAVAKSLEATEPDELTADEFGSGEKKEEQASEAGAAELKPASNGFARPKRPGRR